MYVAGQTSFANFGNAGAYAVGIIRLGVLSNNFINENKYCFCDVENLNNLKRQITHVYNNKQKYIDGPIFKEDAHIHIKNFYESFSNSLKAILKC